MWSSQEDVSQAVTRYIWDLICAFFYHLSFCHHSHWSILKPNCVCIVSSVVLYLSIISPVQFISTFPQWTLSAEQIPLSLPSHLEWSHCEKEYPEEGNRGKWDGLLHSQRGSLASLILEQPPTPTPAALKITSSSSDWPDRLGLWGSIISLEFVQQPGRQKTLPHTLT